MGSRADADPSARLESVTVTASKPDLEEIIRKYVKSFAAPSPFLGRIARWETGICPTVIGLKAESASVIESRIKALAKLVGAPVATKQSCKANVEIIVTPQSQALLDAIRDKKPAVLGYSDGPSQTAKLAIMKQPIQAWYVTATKDYAGVLHTDQLVEDCAIYTGRRRDCFTLVSGFRLNDGLQSDFVNALVIVDSTQAGQLQVSTLANYVALEALAQTQAAQGCRTLPTLTNLIATGCGVGNTVDDLTDTDIAYLRALYKIQSGTPLNVQENDISRDMSKSLSKPGPAASPHGSP